MSGHNPARPREIYRYSEVGLTPQGEKLVWVRTFGHDREDLEPILREGDSIETSEIVSLIERLGFSPTGSEAEELAHELNVIRVTKPKEEGFSDAHRLERFANALKTICEDGPALIKILRTSIETAGSKARPSDVRRRVGWILLLQSQHATARHLRQDRVFHPVGPKKREQPFHRDIEWLCLRLAGLARKHGKRPSFTKDDGLGTEVVRLALERAGISMTTAAIAKAIRRQKDRPLRVIQLD
jgi:hypothetical protein